MLRLACFAVLAASCGTPEKAAPLEPAPKKAPVASKQIDLEATLERIRVVQDELAVIRNLRFSRVVEAEKQGKQAFRRVLIAEVAKTLPTQKSQRKSRALLHLGFLTRPTDIATATIELSSGQVAGYYNPETEKFYVIQVPANEAASDFLVAHELMHGLQDQNFDLRQYVGEPSPRQPSPPVLSEDQLNARRYVVEGEAVVFAIAHGAAKRRGIESVTGDVELEVRKRVAEMNRVPWQAMVAQADALSAEAKPAATKVSDLPPYIVAPTFESYVLGARAVFAVWQAGQTDAVDALYRDPPDSTEQILHPQEKLIKERDVPTGVELPNFENRFGAPLFEDTMGELGWRVYLETWKVPAAAANAAGWDGDRVAVYDSPNGLVGLAALIFDSEDDAIEFESAMQRSARARTERGTTGPRLQRKDGGEIVIERDQTRVYIVDGPSGERATTFLETLKSDTQFR